MWCYLMVLQFMLEWWCLGFLTLVRIVTCLGMPLKLVLIRRNDLLKFGKLRVWETQTVEDVDSLIVDGGGLVNCYTFLTNRDLVDITPSVFVDIEETDKKNTVKLFENELGKRLDSFDQKSSEVVSSFAKQLGAADPDVKGCSTTLLKELMQFNFSLQLVLAWL
ncbi:hypothetical protein V6N13_010042 [Hibiscus sabdariffa]